MEDQHHFYARYVNDSGERLMDALNENGKVKAEVKKADLELLRLKTCNRNSVVPKVTFKLHFDDDRLETLRKQIQECDKAIESVKDEAYKINGEAKARGLKLEALRKLKHAS